MKFVPAKYIVIAVLGVIIPVGMYFINFWGCISSNNGDWGSFGDYLSGIITLLFTLINIAIWYDLAHLQNRFAENQQNSERKFQCVDKVLKIRDLYMLPLRDRDFSASHKICFEAFQWIELGAYNSYFGVPDVSLMEAYKTALSSLYDAYWEAVPVGSDVVDISNQNLQSANANYKSASFNLAQHYISRLSSTQPTI